MDVELARRIVKEAGFGHAAIGALGASPLCMWVQHKYDSITGKPDPMRPAVDDRSWLSKNPGTAVGLAAALAGALGIGAYAMASGPRKGRKGRKGGYRDEVRGGYREGDDNV